MIATSKRLTSGGQCKTGAARLSIRWLIGLSAGRGNEGEGVVDPAQSPGHGAATSLSLKCGLPSVDCPPTKAWRGLQQQWPCSTQQAIVQTSSAVRLASATGALSVPTSKASAASKARHLARLLCRSAFIGSNVIPGVASYSTRIARPAVICHLPPARQFD